MNGPHWKSVLLLIIWCLIGSFPHWGKWGSWIWFGVLILFAILFCRRKSGIQPLFFAEPFPDGLFELEQLHYDGIPLKRTGKDLDLNIFLNKLVQNQKHIDYSEALAIALLIVGGIVGLGGFRNASLFCLIVAILPLVLLTLYSWLVTRQRKTIDRNHSPELANRPAFDCNDSGQCNHLARHYSNALEARYALSFLREWQIGHLIYPEDELLAFIPSEMLAKYPLIAQANIRTFGEFVRQYIALHMPELDNMTFGTNTPPELPAEIKKLFSYKDGVLQQLDSGKVTAYLSDPTIRPLFDRELFISYWATREEAEIAWAIRQIIIEQMDRPEDMMVYPNDPMALMDFWDGDSLEDVEFIMGLEEHFKITIPDSDAPKFFQEFTLKDAVKYIQSKL